MDYSTTVSAAVFAKIVPAATSIAGLLAAALVSDHENDIYNILWILVFGFATINILGLVTRSFEPNRSRLSFGEVLAITVVVVSVALLGWEMLYLFHVLPIKLPLR